MEAPETDTAIGSNRQWSSRSSPSVERIHDRVGVSLKGHRTRAESIAGALHSCYRREAGRSRSAYILASKSNEMIMEPGHVADTRKTITTG